jgi:hypothetical protein
MCFESGATGQNRGSAARVPHYPPESPTGNSKIFTGGNWRSASRQVTDGRIRHPAAQKKPAFAG